jgi:hypothetical protein
MRREIHGAGGRSTLLASCSSSCDTSLVNIVFPAPSN